MHTRVVDDLLYRAPGVAHLRHRLADGVAIGDIDLQGHAALAELFRARLRLVSARKDNGPFAALHHALGLGLIGLSPYFALLTYVRAYREQRGRRLEEEPPVTSQTGSALTGTTCRGGLRACRQAAYARLRYTY